MQYLSYLSALENKVPFPKKPNFLSMPDSKQDQLQLILIFTQVWTASYT